MWAVPGTNRMGRRCLIDALPWTEFGDRPVKQKLKEMEEKGDDDLDVDDDVDVDVGAIASVDGYGHDHFSICFIYLWTQPYCSILTVRSKIGPPVGW